MTRTLAGARTLVARSNNILYNADFETVPAVLTAQTNTTNRWIDGTAAGSNAPTSRGWGLVLGGTIGAAGFDNTNSHSGTYSLKLSNTTIAATCVAASYKTSTPLTRELFVLKPNTTYKLTAWLKTNNVVSNSAFIDLREYSAAIATLATTSSNKLSGTNGWTQVSLTVTTNASTVFGSVLIRNNIAGNISDVWCDDIVLSLVSLGRTAASGRSLV